MALLFIRDGMGPHSWIPLSPRQSPSSLSCLDCPPTGSLASQRLDATQPKSTKLICEAKDRRRMVN